MHLVFLILYPVMLYSIVLFMSCSLHCVIFLIFQYHTILCNVTLYYSVLGFFLACHNLPYPIIPFFDIPYLILLYNSIYDSISYIIVKYKVFYQLLYHVDAFSFSVS